MLSELYHAVVGWLGKHQAISWGLLGFSLLTLLATLVLLPVVVVRIPPDYFAHNRPPQTRWQKLHPVLRMVALVVKNLLGLLLLVAGIVMLFVPGPGVVSMLAGLALMDVPGKRALERWIVTRPPVFDAINNLRAKYRHPPLERPGRMK